MTTQRETKTIKASNTDPSIDQTIDTIASAFASDPAARWVWPNNGAYQAWFPGFVRAFGGAAFAEGSAYYDDYMGAALWLPPQIHPDDQALTTLLEKSVPAEELPNVFAVFEQMAAYHPREPHWHLPLVGVRPEHQGKGYGSALLAPVLARCDSDGMLAYLEATSPHNVRLYERLGFEAVGAIPAGPSAVIVPMVRVSR